MVDAPSVLYQCADDKTEFSWTLEQGKELKCTSPDQAERFFKACKEGQILAIETCQWKEGTSFQCGTESKQMSEIDNYYCLSEAHWLRIQDRCLHQ